METACKLSRFWSLWMNLYKNWFNKSPTISTALWLWTWQISHNSNFTWRIDFSIHGESTSAPMHLDRWHPQISHLTFPVNSSRFGTQNWQLPVAICRRVQREWYDICPRTRSDISLNPGSHKPWTPYRTTCFRLSIIRKILPNLYVFVSFVIKLTISMTTVFFLFRLWISTTVWTFLFEHIVSPGH